MRAGIAAAIAGVIGIKVVIFVVIEIVLLLGNVGERLAADSTPRIIAKGTVYRMIARVDAFLSDRTLDQERIGCRVLIGVRADIAAIDALVVVPRVVGALIDLRHGEGKQAAKTERNGYDACKPDVLFHEQSSVAGADN